MIARDSRGEIISELQHLRDNQGNTFDTVTTYSNGRPAVQLITMRDNQGKVESRTVLGGKLLPQEFQYSEDA